MNNKTLLAFFFGLFLFTGTTFAQKNNVNVNPLTGAGNVVIPLYEYKRGQVDVPISISYNATGVKTKDVENTAGMGWHLNVGGEVSRLVRGLPDDCVKDNTGLDRKGWMNNSNASKISALFATTNDNNPATCTDGDTQVSYINSNFADLSDTEPDIFYVNAPGLSCQLVYDQASAKFQVMGRQDLKISYTTNIPTSLTVPGGINYFIITNDKGINYSFASPETITQTATGGTPVYFKNKYNQYQNGITYYNNWHLIGIIDDGGFGVRFSYTQAHDRTATDPVSLYMPGATTPTLQYKIQQRFSPQILNTIQAIYSSDMPADVLTFSWLWTDSETYLDPNTNKEVTYGSGQTLLTGITGAGMNYAFNYDFPGDPVYGTGYKRKFLRSVTDNRGCAPISYSFRYAGETYSPTTTQYTTTLPDSSSTKVDYWGYYSTANTSTTSLMPKVWIAAPTTTLPQYAIYQNGTTGGNYPYYTTNGNIRSADVTNVASGSLVKVIYPEGGSTTITYEPNDYLDVPSGLVFPGNGIRVKKLIDSAGTTNPIVTNYSYLNPATGVSSGKPLSLPVYAFNVPYSGSATGNTLYNSCTVVSDNDLSAEDHTIMYGYVKQSNTGAGSTLFQYYVPAAYWSPSGTPICPSCGTDWWPTANNVQRTTCATATGPAAANIWGYPFAPNSNYDFERGLLQQVTNYNESGTPVSIASYTYNRSYSPLTISAARIDDLPFSTGTAGLKAITKYTLNYRSDELLVQETNQVFDLPALTQSKTTTVKYFFSSANHKLMTQKQVINSDNSTLTTNIKYVKDYTGLGTSTNRNINALYNLQLLNENLPVETYQQVTRGVTTKTTGANLTMFSDYHVGASSYKYRPSASYNFVNADGATSFTASSVTMPSTFNKDAGYPTLPAMNYPEYDYNGTLQTVDDGRHHVNGTILDNYNASPAITVNNAAASEIAFADFDSDMATPWTYSKTGTSSYVVPAGSHAGAATGLGTGQAFSLTLNKNANAGNYILSAWINTAASGTISFSFSAASGSSVVPGQNIPNTAGVWKYQEWKVSLGTITGTFTVNVSATVNAGVDDIIFYPETAEVSTYSYDAVTHLKTSATNTNGISAYFAYDALGRPVYTMDEKHNIVAKQTYVLQSQVQNWNPVIVAPNGGGHANTPTPFTIGGYDYCTTAGVLITWNFGDGTAPVTTALSSPPLHTYATAGSKTISATVTSPIFGTKVLTPLTVTVGVPLITLSYTNYTTYNDNNVYLTFYNNTTGEVFNIVGSQFVNTQTITQGVYGVSVTTSPLGQAYDAGTGIGWNSTLLHNDTGVFVCGDRNASNTAAIYNVNLSATTAVTIDINRVTCAIATQ